MIQLIDRAAGEVVAVLLFDNPLTVQEALDLAGVPSTDGNGDYIIDGTPVWAEDILLMYN